jgi:plasmid stability protein
MSARPRIYGIDGGLLHRLEQRASPLGRSIEGQVQKNYRQYPAGENASSFEEMAASLRARTASRRQTPSEILLREGRDER